MRRGGNVNDNEDENLLPPFPYGDSPLKRESAETRNTLLTKRELSLFKGDEQSVM